MKWQKGIWRINSNPKILVVCPTAASITTTRTINTRDTKIDFHPASDCKVPCHTISTLINYNNPGRAVQCFVNCVHSPYLETPCVSVSIHYLKGLLVWSHMTRPGPRIAQLVKSWDLRTAGSSLTAGRAFSLYRLLANPTLQTASVGSDHPNKK